jgi:hypothetical protein
VKEPNIADGFVLGELEIVDDFLELGVTKTADCRLQIADGSRIDSKYRLRLLQTTAYFFGIILKIQAYHLKMLIL